MNQLTQYLIDSILSENTTPGKTALFGGGFKPPTRGHLEVVTQGLKDNPEVDEVYIFVGSGVRNNISQEESIKIWEMFKPFIPVKTTIIPAGSPLKDIKRFIEDMEEKPYVFIGARPDNEDDDKDVIERSKFFEKYGGIPKRVNTSDSNVSGTKARAAAKNDNKQELFSYFPEGLTDSQKEEIYDMLRSVVKETDNPDDGKAAPYGSGYGKVNENASYSKDIDIKGKIDQLTQHMISKGYNIEPLPSLEFVDGDTENARDFFGKTAYYDPTTQTVVLYTEGRHPKDIVRSYAHEMIHHIQNLEGRLGNITTTNTQEDDHLNDIEAEANLKGTMTFRNWTDSLNEGLEDVSLDYIKTKHPKLNSYPKSDIILSKGDFIYINIPQDKDFGMTAEIKAFDKKDGTLVAQSSFDYDKNGKLKGTLDVRPDKRRLGIATEIYKLSEKIIGDTIFPEEKHTEDAKKFWQQKNRSFGPKTDDNLNENILPQEKFAQEKNQDYIEQALKILPNKGKYNLKNYSVEILPIDKIKPTQFGEDYINASSEYEAEQYQKYIDGEIEAEDLRREDFYPIVVDKDTMEILDGNHRHAVHTMLSIPKIKAILVSKKLNEAIVGEKIKCDNCGWSWNIVDGGDDLYICHKCDHDNEPENGDPFGLKAYARELVNETFKKSVIIDMGPIVKALEFEMPTGQETDENAIAIIDAAPQGKVPHPVFLDFYAKFDKYFGEKNDDRMLDNIGLEYLLSNILNLSSKDIQTVINHYNTTDQDSVEWFEQHDNELEKDEEYTIPGFDDANDDYESVVNYRRQQLAKSLEEQERVRIFTTNCGCDKT